MSPYRIKGLSISSVDSVDKGAGVGCEVKILKRHDERTKPMTHMSIAKQLNEAMQNGSISSFEYGTHMQEMATAMFPTEPSIGAALHKFFQTLPGQQMLANTRQPDTKQAIDTFAKRHPEIAKNQTQADETEPWDKSENPFHRALTVLADHELETGNVKGSREQAFTHLATKNPLGQKLMARATAWDLKRQLRSQGNA